MILLTGAVIEPLTINYGILLKNVLISFWWILQKCWISLLVLAILLIVASILKKKTIQRNNIIRAQREEELWEQRMEKFLEKKEQRDRITKK